MADHVITLAPEQPGPSPDGNGRIYEDVNVVGDGVGTSGVYRSRYIDRPERVIGGFAYSINGRQVTLSSAAFTGTQSARIIGLA